MKTPQEEAERLIMRVALHDDKSLDEIIPLSELIAVARAAAKSQALAAIFNDEDIELQDALQALRATGKVEGI